MGKITKTIAMSVLCFSLMGQSYADNNGVDQYGISIAYPSGASKSGCSELAWQQNVSYYQSKISEYNKNAEQLNKKILDMSIDPKKLNFGDSGCLDNLVAKYDKLKEMYKNFSSATVSFSGFGQAIFNSVMNAGKNILKQKVNDAICKVSNKADSALSQMGIDKVINDANSISKNPLGFAINKAGVSNINLGGSSNLEFGKIVEDSYKQANTQANNNSNVNK